MASLSKTEQIQGHLTMNKEHLPSSCCCTMKQQIHFKQFCSRIYFGMFNLSAIVAIHLESEKIGCPSILKVLRIEGGMMSCAVITEYNVAEKFETFRKRWEEAEDSENIRASGDSKRSPRRWMRTGYMPDEKVTVGDLCSCFRCGSIIAWFP